ncbi:MAG: SDR family NAD(P)-dependent oxidoreductase, partial [Actinomycetota bacterium]
MADPRVALVTGAAGQIGTALLRRLAAEGFHTAGTDLAPEPPPPVADVVGLWLPGDVTELADMQHVVAEVLRRWSRLDVLVVNAGVTAIGTFADTSDEAFSRVMDVNFHGALRITRAALPALRESRGRIAVLSSVAGFAPVAGRPAYTASKHALTGLFESIRHELAADDVGLTMIYPSFLRTPPADLNSER